MSVRLRLARYGSKKRPYYRIMVADRRARRDGSFIEQIGTYDPAPNPVEVRLDADRMAYWLGKGATPTDTVKNLLDRHYRPTEAAPAT